ncbi:MULTISPECIES: TetR family transcriptional regulator [unclassified Paenibacillus]|uniref:TetR family transcriptional regulator n=1 Tax=unclassified Paenibacillus TaxID=185978 RepID=UPI000955B3FC|nr:MULTISPECIES: TetR family transcriptional regulator [unclassified Paenibacillus]ASS65420.2 TetR/AcrR family transcriptional regulator [Paenibacillus sp. RUD330]SIQ36882.1 transcriptional regulator, TetR family [Paenibacillus sp. RU4X]SIQ58949.1 transcriptional regulator, TetR family [Paenibacillus sp. RU4T]
MSPKLSTSRKEQRSLQILDAAKRVFADKGYASATLKDIIEETGMSRGWIYLYYQTKEEIFEALLDHQDADYGPYLDSLEESSSSIWEVVTKLYSRQLQDLTDSSLMPAFYEYFLIGWRDETRRILLRSRYDRGIAQFAALLQKGVDRGEFIPVMEVTDISRIAASFQEGIVTHSFTVGMDKANTRMQLQALLTYLSSMLRPGHAGQANSREETL